MVAKKVQKKSDVSANATVNLHCWVHLSDLHSLPFEFRQQRKILQFISKDF